MDHVVHWRYNPAHGVASAWVEVPKDFLSGLSSFERPAKKWRHAWHGNYSQVRLELTDEGKVRVYHPDFHIWFDASQLMRELIERGVRP